MSTQETVIAGSREPLAEEPYPDDEGASLPRLLKGISERGAMTLEAHLALHGPLALEGNQTRRGSSLLIDQIDRAGLRGRGGGGFPTATKMRAVSKSRGRAILVVNASESEPASRKDQMLLQTLPHLMLDGAQLAARAVRANEVIVGICESAGDGAQIVSDALEERRGSLPHNLQMHVRTVPSRYVAGQESALVNHLNGAPALPSFTPPMPFQQGVSRRPTLVANAETLAHVALIARRGPRWFRRLGTPSQPGTTLVTLSGPLTRPGVYEIEYGVTLSALLDAAGGTTARTRALLIGGYGGSWIDGELLDGVVLSDEHLAPHNARLGAGVLLLLSEDACPVAETARVTRWLADQSAGQCGPCVHGLGAIAANLQELARGAADRGAIQRLGRLAALVRGRGACGHPDGAANFILSALDTFAPELAYHARHGPCEACAQPAEMPLPAWPPTIVQPRKPISIR